MDFVGGPFAGVGSATPFESTDHLDGHVPVASDLTTEPDTGQASSGKKLFFRGGDGGGFAREEFNSARGAASVAATGVELIDLSVVGEGEDKTLAGRDIKRADAVDGEHGHGCSFQGVMEAVDGGADHSKRAASK
jgi:hypothetical protein